MNENLSQKKCVACRAGVPCLSQVDQTRLLGELADGWKVIEGHHLVKTFTLKNFAQALDLTNRIGAIAEAEGHHPDILLSWGKVVVTTWTHKVDGLTENDFILAAKIDLLKG